MAQVLGGIAAAAVVYAIALGQPDFQLAANGLAANGFGEHSPGGYSILSALIAEVLLTLFFLIIVMGATNSNARGVRPARIGLALTLIHQISIPITGDRRPAT